MPYYLLATPKQGTSEPPKMIRLVQQPPKPKITTRLLMPVVNIESTNRIMITDVRSVARQEMDSVQMQSTSNVVVKTEPIDTKEQVSMIVGQVVEDIAIEKTTQRQLKRQPEVMSEEDREKMLKAARESLLNGRITLNMYVWRLIKDRLQEDKIKCNICSVIMVVRYCNRRQRTGLVTDHVRRHLNKVIYVCQRCDDGFCITLGGAKHHVKEKHNLQSILHINDLSSTVMDELADMAESCFGGNHDTKVAEESLALGEYLQRAIVDRIIGRSVQCRICQLPIRIGSLKRLQHAFAIDHLFKHLDKNTFTCLLCDDYHCRMRVSIKRHVKKVHQQRTNSTNVQDNTDLYLNEIKGLIDQCYGRPEGFGKSSFELPQDTLDQSERLRSRVIFRRTRELIEKYAESLRMTCQLCFKSTQAKESSNKILCQFVVDHATEHLGKPLYQCRYCQKWNTGRTPMIMHVINSHSKSSKEGYLNLSPKHVDEIVHMLNKCYDKEYQKNREDSVAKFGLEESDDESDSEMGDKPKVWGQRYNLRPRRPRRKRRIVKEVVKKKHGYEYGKSPMQRQPRVRMRLVCSTGVSYECRICGMSSKYKGLVKGHLRVMHLVGVKI